MKSAITKIKQETAVGVAFFSRVSVLLLGNLHSTTLCALSVQSGILSRYLSALTGAGETGKEGDGEGGSADRMRG